MLALPAMTLVALVAGAAPPPEAAVTRAEPGLRVALGLPAAPPVVVLDGRTYGSVTVPHKKHLELRVSCMSCHDQGRPVGKIEFTARIAHERCVGCHREEQAGPTSCHTCHDKSRRSAAAAAPAAAKPEAPAPVAAAPGPKTIEVPIPPAKRIEVPLPPPPPGMKKIEVPLPPPPPGTELQARGDEPPATGTAVETRTFSATNLSQPPPPRPAEELRPEEPVDQTAWRHDLEVGLLARRDVGPSVRVSQRRGVAFRAYGIERLPGDATTRTLMTGDLGVVVVARPWSVIVSVLGGCDVQEEPRIAISGTLGGRVRLEWSLARSSGLPVRLHATLTGLHDFPPQAVGPQTTGTRTFVTFGTSVGFRGF